MFAFVFLSLLHSCRFSNPKIAPSVPQVHSVFARGTDEMTAAFNEVSGAVVDLYSVPEFRM